jgi:hypothetical protein
MIAALRLLPLLLRRSPRQTAEAMALCAAGVAVATMVAGTLLVAQDGLSLREDRLVWREPAAVAERDATALVRRGTELYRGEGIDVVEIAPTGAGVDRPGQVPVPPGLTGAPGPGQAVVSPALAELIERVPAEQLGDRFGQVVGTIGPDGLTRPDELVAVLGRPVGGLGPPERTGGGFRAEDRMPGSPSPVTPIAAFDDRGSDSLLKIYRELGLVAVALVVVPAAMLVGSSARLTAARRERRLAALRLAGATPWAVRALTASETALGAAVGAVAGVAAARIVAPLLRGVEVAGGSWFGGDLALGPARAALLAAVATAISVVVAVVSLRRVTASPLGVARASEARSARWPRLIALAVSLLVMVVSAASASNGGSVVAMIAALAMVMASLALVGPWITSLLGRLLTRVARRPSTLIAGRRIREDPGACYRVVGAVVLAGMVAGFLAVVMPTAASLNGAPGSDRRLEVWMPAAAVPELERIAGSMGAGVELADDGLDPTDPSPRWVTVELGADTSVEELRTATAPLRRGATLSAPTDDLWGDATLTDDIGRGAIVVLVAALLLAAAASTVAAAASVLDQRRTLGRLVLAGVDVDTLHRSRRWQTTLPLVSATTGSIALGLGCGVALMTGFGVQQERIVDPSAVQLLGVVAVSWGIGLMSAAVTRPMLVAVTRAPDPVAR